jgi:hypothetical protein
MSNAFPQQDPYSYTSPVRQILLAHKSMLQWMSQELQPPADMLKIETSFVSGLINDLNSIVVELKSLKGNAEAWQYVRNVGRVHEIIRDYALVELYTALHKLGEGDTQEYFRCLFRSSDYLEEALQEFLI